MVTLEERDWYHLHEFQLHNDAGDEFTASGQRGSYEVGVTVCLDRGAQHRWVVTEQLGVHAVASALHRLAVSREQGLPLEWALAALRGLYGDEVRPDPYEQTMLDLRTRLLAAMPIIQQPGPVLRGITSS